MASPGPLHDWIEALPEDGKYVFARADVDEVTDASAAAIKIQRACSARTHRVATSRS